jgi:hypothetical protein
MSNIQNDAKQAIADATAAVVATRRHLGTRLFASLRHHPHAMLALVAALVVIAVALGVLKG